MTREARHIIDKKVGRKPTEFLVSWSWKDVTLFNLEGTRREIEGDIAQLGERLPCKQEVAGSIPTISTTQLKNSRTQIKAQRSGFDLKRRRSGASELSPEGGSEGCGTCADERARSSAG